MKTQVVVVHGGDTFETYDEYISFLKSYEIDLDDLRKEGWKHSLGKKLGSKFEVLLPEMPNKSNAKYLEWKIWFDKIVPLLQDNLILIGHSLGGIFLAKYLSENNFPKKILGTLLVAPPFDAKDSDYTLADFILSKDLSRFEEQGGAIKIYHSKDDYVVPFADLEKYKKALPSASTSVFENYGHFGVAEFPEIVEEIKSLTSSKN